MNINWPVPGEELDDWADQLTATLQRYLSAIPDPLQVGVTVLFPGSSVPQGYLPTGATIDQKTYPALYSMVGATIPPLSAPAGYTYGVKAG